jgi:hypothetical protein
VDDGALEYNGKKGTFTYEPVELDDSNSDYVHKSISFYEYDMIPDRYKMFLIDMNVFKYLRHVLTANEKEDYLRFLFISERFFIIQYLEEVNRRSPSWITRLQLNVYQYLQKNNKTMIESLLRYILPCFYCSFQSKNCPRYVFHLSSSCKKETFTPRQVQWKKQIIWRIWNEFDEKKNLANSWIQWIPEELIREILTIPQS